MDRAAPAGGTLHVAQQTLHHFFFDKINNQADQR